MSNTDRWLTALNTAYRMGWWDGKKDAQDAVSKDGLGLGHLIAWIPFEHTPDLSGLLPDQRYPYDQGWRDAISAAMRRVGEYCGTTDIADAIQRELSNLKPVEHHEDL